MNHFQLFVNISFTQEFPAIAETIYSNWKIYIYLKYWISVHLLQFIALSIYRIISSNFLKLEEIHIFFNIEYQSIYFNSLHYQFIALSISMYCMWKEYTYFQYRISVHLFHVCLSILCISVFFICSRETIYSSGKRFISGLHFCQTYHHPFYIEIRNHYWGFKTLT